ncbi:MAG: hypothetical protein KDD47_21555 [Acidobacteria bacterium]|nr:hypothetical protein [Acidobacteriota bacterium]
MHHCDSAWNHGEPTSPSSGRRTNTSLGTAPYDLKSTHHIGIPQTAKNLISYFAVSLPFQGTLFFKYLL